MKTENGLAINTERFAGHHEARQALVLFYCGGDGHHADREFYFAGLVLTSLRVRLAVDKAVTVEPVREFTLKGIRRPMMTYNVLSSLGAKPN